MTDPGKKSKKNLKPSMASIALGISIIAILLWVIYFFCRNNIDKDVQYLNKQMEEFAQYKLDTILYAKKGRLDSLYYDRIISFEHKHQEFVLDIKNQNNRIETMAWVFGGLTLTALLTGIIGFFFQLFNGFSEKAEVLVDQKATEMVEKYHEEISKIVEENGERVFKELIKDKTNEIYLKENLSIGVICLKKEEKEEVKNYFDSMGFDKMKILGAIDENNDIEHLISKQKKSDILFFYGINDDGERVEANPEKSTPAYTKYLLLNEKINPWAKKLNEDINFACFYYGKGRFQGAEKLLVSFANTRTTIYHNLIDLMRYKNAMDAKH